MTGSAEVSRHAVGADGVAGRIGGDEFAVALPRAAPFQLVTLAERVRAAVNAATVTAI
jgi:GGDEF domain-containing protein